MKMKAYKMFFIAAAAAALASCNKIESIAPESGTMLASQVQKTNEILPARAAASFAGMFTSIGEPDKLYSTPDDWQFIMINFCNDLEGADALIPDSGYNWFSVCGEYSSRNANYRNPYIRYRAPYNMIASVNTFCAGFAEDVSDPSSLNMIAQAKVLRAYSYLSLAPDYQFNYQIAKDEPCVPLCSDEVEDFTQNPRATVGRIYEEILKDLDEAIEALETPEIKAVGRTTKMYIDANVAHGLRARAYLDMGEWQKAYDDAVAAAEGYTPATIAELSDPDNATRINFKDLSEHNWIWGYDLTKDLVQSGSNTWYANSSAWLRSFSLISYSAACQCYTCCNKLLWDLIPSTDVRKGWWVDENLESPLLEGWAWPGFNDVANADDGQDKLPFLAYTNVKFGCNTIATELNDEDSPLMRVEEMILIQAECKERLSAGAGKAILEDFVQTYRDPSYSADAGGRNILDEIWFQRRVELWGEGFYVRDMRRLNKPLVRFHGLTDKGDSQPDAFRFNMTKDDPWLLMRFPQGETNTNFAIVDNTGSEIPSPGQNPELRDGVTD